MSKTLTLTPKGLYTYYNNLASVPEGALLKANNTVINREGVAEPRRGIKWYTDAMPDYAKQLLQYKATILRHVGSTIAYDNLGTFTDFSGSFDQPNIYTRIKSLETKGNLYFTSDSGVKKISAKTAGDLATATITDAGGVVSIGAIASVLVNSGGFLNANSDVAYKVTWAIKDANNLLIEGVPSNASLAQNISAFGNAIVQLKVLIPYEVTITDYTMRIYRTAQVATGTAISEEYNLVFEGNPTLGEISAGYLFYNDSLPDDFRDGGLPLYTNPTSGSGALQSNFKPPFATDIELFNNHTFYANTRIRHYKSLSLQSMANFATGTSNFIITDGTTTNTYTFIGTSEESEVKFEAFSFITDGSYFFLNSANNERRYFVWFDTTDTTPVPNTAETIGRIPIRVNIHSSDNTGTLVAGHAKTAIEAATDDFIITQATSFLNFINQTNGFADATADSVTVPTNLTFSTISQGTGEDASLQYVLLDDSLDQSIAIRRTADSLVRIINQNPAEIVTAQYVSGLNDTPGNIVLIRKNLSTVPFYTNTTHNAIRVDFYPNLSSIKHASDNSTSVNTLFYSKLDEPESVPLVNYITIGASDAPILRIKALRESLFVFKTDGLYRLTGFNGDFTVTLFDNTILLKVPDSVAVLNNEIYYYGTQGVAKVSEVGKDVISKPIQDKLLPYITTATNLAKVGFGVAYETDRSYMLWTVSNKNDTVATVCYRYNIETEAWTEWNISKTCAVLNTSYDLMFYGSGSSKVIEIERKNFDRFDYCDREIVSTLPTLSTYGAIIKPSGTANMEIGDVLIQYQYLTITRFNQILKMIDSDVFMGDSNNPLYPSFSPLAGESLTARVATFIAELNVRDTDSFSDTWGNTSYVFSGTTDPETIQIEWNKAIDRLNQSPTAFLSNYPTYTGVVLYEALIIDKNISDNSITVNNELPWLEGNLTTYKAIETEIEYAPQHGGDPIDFKQFSTAQAVFEYRSFHLASLEFNSDLSTDFETIDFSLNSAAAFGNFSFGDGAVWGGKGDKAPLRTYIPRNKQRSRFIGAKFYHKGALETYGLYGIAITYNSYSDRAYK